MDTIAHIVEAYVREVKRWATIPSIQCSGQLEINLLAINPRPCGSGTKTRFHIEIAGKTSRTFARLTSKPYDTLNPEGTDKKTWRGNSLEHYLHNKFLHPDVYDALLPYGFHGNNYARILVAWGWDEGVAEQAKGHGLTLWSLRDMIQELADVTKCRRPSLCDETIQALRTLCRIWPPARNRNRTPYAQIPAPGSHEPPKFSQFDVVRLVRPYPAAFDDGLCTLLPGMEGTVLDVYGGGALGPHAYGFDYMNGVFDPDAGIYGCNGYEIITEDVFELVQSYKPERDVEQASPGGAE